VQLSPEESQLIYLLISVAILISVSALYTKWRKKQEEEEEKTQCRGIRKNLTSKIFTIEARVSKTEMAKSIARMKNVERSRSSMQKHRGSFKPKTAFEKRLWKSNKKPEED